MTVDAVKVFAQPVGALLSASVGNEALRHLQAARTLIVDVGWRTFDWVVTSGSKIHDTRSDSVARSMFDVVDAVGRAASRDLGYSSGRFDYARIDEALRKMEPVRIFGHPLSLEPYLPLGQRIADEAVTAMKRLVQDGTDIDAIVLAGGGAFFFGEAIARAYPKHNVVTLPDAFYVNCRGFQLAGLYHDRGGAASGATAASERDVTTPDQVEASGGSTRMRRAKGATITVRLFPEIHGAVLEALARVSRADRGRPA